MFAKMGEMLPPCGVPSSGYSILPSSSSIPAFNHFDIKRMKRLSSTLRAINSSKTS
jgi:hypothetical protein